VLSLEQKQELLRCLRKDDCYKDKGYEEFCNAYKKEIKILNDMVTRYLAQYRKDKEWECREKVIGSLYQIADDSEDLRTGLEEALSTLRDFLSVKYLALFLGLGQGDLVLPLVAQSGLKWDEVDSVLFNWRKAGLAIDGKAFDTIKWLSMERTSRESFENYMIKGTKGHGKDKFFPAICLLPVGHQYRGVLAVGQPKDETVKSSDLLSNELGGMDFLQNVGHLIVTHALSKRVLQSSIQHDKRRDQIVALTAHSIRASLHRFWDATERVRFYWQKPEHAERVRRAIDEMIEIIRTMKKNVKLAMAAPESTVTPDIHRSEMEIELINLAALLHNCVDAFKLQARDKQIKMVINDEVDELPLIHGDRYMLGLIFSNILDNAIKYSKTGKEVRIDTKPELLETVQIVIEDFGWGIPEKDLEQIFEPGFQSPKVEKMERSGVGLGLHQAREFVRLHGGKLWATSHPIHPEALLSSHIVSFFVRLPIKGAK
jgi:signal transduction histidine kinase